MNPAQIAQIVQRPAGLPGQLILLFHGFGTDEQAMMPLARLLAIDFPQAFVVSIGAPDFSDCGAGRQWFSLRELTEANRIKRVAAAMPSFLATVRHWQKAAGVGVEATALIGFAQGAIMALETTHELVAVAGRIVAIAGRFAGLPERATRHTTLHLIHGKADPVVPYAHTIAVAERLIDLGSDVTADVMPFVGHEINDEVAALVVERLQGYVPRRIWEAAMRAAAGN